MRAYRRRIEAEAPLRVLDELAQDARFAVRGLRRSPGFAALAILVLALAIAANTAIFALVDVLMLRPIGLREPERLIRVFNKNTAETDAFRSISYPNYLDLRDGTPTRSRTWPPSPSPWSASIAATAPSVASSRRS